MLVEAPSRGHRHWLPHEGQLLGSEGVLFLFDLSRRWRPSPWLCFCFWGGRSAFLPTFPRLVLDFLPNKAFFLYDTLGFPINLTELMAQEAGMTVDMEGFAAEMKGQKRQSGKARLAARGLLRWQGRGQWWW